LGEALTNSFNAALDNGENFFVSIGKALLQLIKKLLIAAAVAALLSFFLGGFGAASSVAGFAPIFKQLSGLDFSQGSASGSMVAMPTSTTAQGNVSFEIQGDKLYGVLQNYNGRLNRLV